MERAQHRNTCVAARQESLALAKQIAEDWYLELRGKARAGLLLIDAAPAKARSPQKLPRA